MLPSGPVRFRHPRLISIFLIAAAVFCLYSVSLGHNFLFDEDDIILLNPVVRHFESLKQLFSVGFFQKGVGIGTVWEQYYRPLTLFTFVIDHKIWDVNPLGYNLMNTLIHVAVSALFFLLLLKIFKSHRIAFLSAFLFAVHTIHTEAVTYIASRGDLLGAAFTLSAMLLYWNENFVGAFIAYGLSTFCKESCLVMPLYLVLLDFVFIRTGWKKLFLRMLPFFGAGALYVVFRKLYSPVPMGPPTFDAHEAALRFFSMGPPVLSYLQALLVPAKFKFCESIDYAQKFFDPRVATTLAVAALFLTGWFTALRRRGAAFFGLTLFMLSLGPSLQIIHYFPEWAEHYLYVPSMGLAILLGALMREIFSTGKKSLLAAFLAVYLPFAGFIAYRTYERNSYYRDTTRYYTTLARSDSPYAYYGYINLGIQAIIKSSWDDAAIPLRTAYLMFPESECNNYNLGLYYFNKKLYERAAFHFKKAYDTPAGEHQAVNLVSEGTALTRLGRYDEAIAVYAKAQPMVPSTAAIYRDLMRANQLAGRSDEARRWAEKGLAEPELLKSPADHAALLLETALLAYLNGWDRLAGEKLDELLAKHASIPWFYDTARVLRGKITVAEYETLVQQKYPYNAKDARLYELIADVLAGRKDEAAAFIKKNRTAMEASSDDPLIIKKIFERAERAIALPSAAASAPQITV